MRGLWRDARHALRLLGRAPGFAAVAILTLALGIGANTAIFSLVRGVLLTPLPYPEPGEIVRVWPERLFSKQVLDDFDERSRTLESLSGYVRQRLTLTGVDQPEEIVAAAVSPEHFTLLRVEAALGRTFLPEERRPGRGGVVILSHELWQRRFGGAPDVLGRTLELEDPSGGASRTVVGVLPAGFFPLDRGTEAWIPLTFDAGDAHDYRDMVNLRALARLAPGVSLGEASAEVGGIARRLPEEVGGYYREKLAEAGVTPLQESLVREARPTLWLLFGAVGMVLLIACSNLANLLLARAGGRRRQVAVQAALGASRLRLIRQLLTESAVLGLAGAGAGLLLAVWVQAALTAGLLADLPRAGEVTLAWPELAFASALALTSALLAGLAPALHLTRPGGRSALAGAGRAGLDGPGRQRLNRALVAAEVALAMVLVAAASLVVKSLWNLGRVDPGFVAGEVLSLRLKPPASRYPGEEALRAYFGQVIQAVQALPGVTAVGAIDYLPVTSTGPAAAYSAVEDPAPGQPAQFVSFRVVWPGYLRSLGIPLLAGRDLSSADRADAPAVGLVNQALARRHWPGEEAVGRRLYWGDGSPWLTVVGVVGDVRQGRLDQAARPEVYLPFAQSSSRHLHLTVRTTGVSAGTAAVVAAARSVDSQVPLSQVRSMDQVVGQSLAPERSLASLLAAFAALALGLGMLGVYGVGSYTVAQRTREIGVRMALGAAPGELVRRVLAREMMPVAAGIATGTLAALAAGRLLASRLYEVSAADPRVFAVVAAALAAGALAAVHLPARRAAAVDPAVALRGE